MTGSDCLIACSGEAAGPLLLRLRMQSIGGSIGGFRSRPFLAAAVYCRLLSAIMIVFGVGSFGACVGLGLGLGFSLRFFLQQRLTVGDRNLVIVGMNFTECQETVAVAAVVHERGLERGFNPRDFG